MMADPQPQPPAVQSQAPEQVTQDQKELEAEARRFLTELRKSINRFHTARLSTNAAIAGTAPNRKGLPPWEVAQKVRELRDTERTNQAVSDLRDLLTLMYGRQPTENELEAGPPGGEALGVWVIPGSVVALAAIAGGAWSLAGLFNYLTERELRIQSELGIRNTSVWDTIVDWAPTAAVVAGAGVAGFLLWRKYRGRAPDKESLTEREPVYVEQIEEEEEEPPETAFEEAHEAISALPAHEEEEVVDELAELKERVSEGASV